MALNRNLPAPTFDLETYASNYEGALLPLRLAHIATHCPPLARQSLTRAINAAKNGKDVQLYTNLHAIAARLGFDDLATPDVDWSTKQEEANKRELSRLEGELRGYKNNLIRESIRMGQEDLAVHLLLTGGPPPDPTSPSTNPSSSQNVGYNAAYQAFGKMRDYCTTPTHVASMQLRLLYVSLLHSVSAQQAGSSPVLLLNAALANANRLRTVGVKEEEMAKLVPIMNASQGFAHLGLGGYHDAAQCFLVTSPDYATVGSVHGTDFTRAVASGSDVAIAGGLCALATLNREVLLSHVLGGPFRAFLELEPHMRKAIGLYTTAKYQACLELLRHYYADWSLDIFLGAPATMDLDGPSHVDRLFARIREKSITAYFSSFSQVSLASLAETFPPTISSSSSSPQAQMEEEVLSMINAGTLSARLDVVNGVLSAPQTDTRAATHTEAQTVAEDVERTLLLRLHKVNMTLAGLEVPRNKAMGSMWASGDVRVGNGY